MNDRRNSFFRLFLLILLCLGVQSLRAQTVTKVFKNEPLKAVLKEVADTERGGFRSLDGHLMQ